MRSVRDFMKLVLKESGVEWPNEIKSGPVRVFWRALMALGWKKKIKDVHECSNIYAVAPLTDKEWKALLKQFHAVLSGEITELHLAGTLAI